MMKTTIKNQKQLDAIEKNYRGTINIEGGTYSNPLILRVNFQHADVIIKINSHVKMFGDSKVNELFGYVKEMLNDSQIKVMRDNSQVDWMLNNSRIKVMWRNSQINRMLDDSQVKEMWENSQVKDMRDNSQVKGMSDNSQVKEMSDNSYVNRMLGNSQVDRMFDNSQINRMRGNSQVKEMSDNSQVEVMFDDSQVKVMSDNSQIKGMQENSQVKEMFGEASLSAYGTQKITCQGYNIIRIRKSNEKNCNIILNETSHLIIIPDPEPTFKDYVKRHPVKIHGKKAIMYKVVHKKKVGDKIVYFSDYDRSFEYEISKTIEIECDKSLDVICSHGIHIFHKSGAIKWGNGWSDFALLECEVPIDKIIVPNNNEGKIRVSELKVIKEIIDY